MKQKALKRKQAQEFRIKAFMWMLIGGMGVLAFSLIMNQMSSLPKPKKKEATAGFEVQKIIKQKPKPKPKPKPRKSKPKATPKAAAPSVGSNIAGIDLGLDNGVGFEDDDSGLLGDTSDVVMSAESVDKPPKAAHRTAMEFPKSALKQKISGYVVMNILIGKDGRVKQVSILESQPKGVFDEAARSGVSDWVFTPAMYQGKKVKVWAKQKIRFSLD